MSAAPEGAPPPAAAVEALLAAYPQLASGRLGEGSWFIVLEGEVRLRIPVVIEAGARGCTLRSFLLRGPRPGPGRAALHRALLRRNAVLPRVRLCLDADDDVVIIVRIPAVAVSVEELDAALGEVQSVGEESFEGLVHTAYPGVFPPLRGGTPLPPSAPSSAGAP